MTTMHLVSLVEKASRPDAIGGYILMAMDE